MAALNDERRRARVRVGWFGGTFDPPHEGHLAVARAAAAEFQLSRVLVAPTGRQPLKAAPPGAGFEDRLAMVELLCQGSPGLEGSALDAPREDGSANYTIDSLRSLRARLGNSDEIFVIVGADAFLDLWRWREPDALLGLAEWIVVNRPGFALSDLDRLQLTAAQRGKVHLLGGVAVPVSATEIRQRLRNGEECEGLVPEAVLGYIRAHHLYRTRA